jgi:hypothetical protein
MVVEGRTITTLAELQEFCEAAVAAAHADPANVRLHNPQNMRVTEVTRPDGAKVYDLSVASAA